MKFSKMIERMEDLILSGMGVPFTPWTVVNGDKMAPLLDRIRESLPEEIRHAQHVLSRREELIADAQRRAEQMIEDARRQADVILSDSELMRAIREEADRVRQQVVVDLEAHRRKAFEEADALKNTAAEEARQLREGSERYADTVLSSLERQLAEFQGVVRNGQQYVRKSRADAMQALRPETPLSNTANASGLSGGSISPRAGGIRPANIPTRPARASRQTAGDSSRRMSLPPLVSGAASSSSGSRDYLPLERPLDRSADRPERSYDSPDRNY
ncbi:MAG: ATP synthase F0 subunit B [Vampirovibrionales bacterium]|nr:ATP synthase F0 subunit B [Vampirovibrionales bacterium]